jgi:hypothetical protein
MRGLRTSSGIRGAFAVALLIAAVGLPASCRRASEAPRGPAPPSAVPATARRVAGVVEDRSHHPIAGAAVSFPDLSVDTRTDAEGRFDVSAEGTAGDRVQVRVTKEGYAPAEQSVAKGNVQVVVSLERS